jgi:hypothetical protein
MHNLFAIDPATVTIPFWQALEPMPATGDSESVARRIERAEMQLRIVDHLSPDLRRRHPMEAVWPEECITLLELSGASERFTIYLDVPTYREWLVNHDMGGAYRRLRATIDAVDPLGSRIVLKASSHLPYVGLLREVWPEAKFVLLERDIDSVVQSFGRLATAARLVFSADADADSVTKEWSEVWRGRCEMSARLAEIAVASIGFDEISNEPVRAMEECYAALGWLAGAQVTGMWRRWIAENPRRQ